MRVPIYNYYLGKPTSEVGLSRGRYDEKGNYVYGPYEKDTYKNMYGYTSGKIALHKEALFYIDLPALFGSPQVGYAYFYNQKEELIGSRWSLGPFEKHALPEQPLNWVEAPEGASSVAFEFFPSKTFELSIKDTGALAGFIKRLYTAEPHFKELSKKYSRENTQMFFRESLEGKIKFQGTDFDRINSSAIDDKLLFAITKNGKLYSASFFYKVECSLDKDKLQCEPKLSNADAYAKILDSYENTYDLIKLSPPTETINYKSRRALQIYLLGGNTVTTLFGETWVDNEVSEAITDDATLKGFQFAWVDNLLEIDIDSCEQDPKVNGVYVAKAERAEVHEGASVTLKQPNGYYIKLLCYRDATADHCLALQIFDDKDNLLADTGRQELNCLQARPGGAVETFFISVGRIISLDLVSKFLTIGRTGYGTSSIGTFNIDKIFTSQPYIRVLCDRDSVDGVNLVDIRSDDFAGGTYTYKKCAGLGNVQANLYFNAYDSKEPTKYGQNDYKKYFTQPNISAIARGYSLFRPICRNSWINASIWYKNDILEDSVEPKYRSAVQLKDAYSVGSVIKYLLAQIDPRIEHEATEEYSSFLYGQNNPVYDTGKPFRVYLTQKTNILKGNYDQAAQKAEASLKAIMDMLNKCFNCYWYIEDYKFKVEHLSFFKKGGSYAGLSSQLDLTKQTDQFNKAVADYYQSSTGYDMSEAVKRYEFNWQDDSTDSFGNLTLDCLGQYLESAKTEQVTVANFSSEVDFMKVDPSRFSNDGLALLCPIQTEDGTLELPIQAVRLQDENMQEYDADVQNYYASWPFLVRAFYLSDMSSYNIKINTIPGNIVVGGLKFLKTEDIEAFFEEDPDVLKGITTKEGLGLVDEVLINLLTRKAKIKLKHELK